MANTKITIVGDIINNAYGRARKAFTDRNLEGFQAIARSQRDHDADFLDVNIDGTQVLHVRLPEMLAFLPDLIPALQEATDLPLCFDNPSLEFHQVALEHYDASKSGRPILNSIAASREHLDEMIQLVKSYDTLVLVMASEKLVDGESTQCGNAEEVYRSAKQFTERLVTEADRSLDQIILDTGLAPVGADTYGLVNMGLDGMKMIRDDKDMQGVHMSVGLSNFAWGTPKDLRHELERAYLALANPMGLDFALANPEKNPQPLDPSDPLVDKLRNVLEQGRPQDGESQEEAGFRQAASVLNLMPAVE